MNLSLLWSQTCLDFPPFIDFESKYCFTLSHKLYHMDTCSPLPPPSPKTHTCSNLFTWKVPFPTTWGPSNLLDLICDPPYPPPSPIPELFKIVHLRNSPSPVPIGKRAVGLRLKGLLVSSLKLVALIRCWVYHVPFLSFFFIFRIRLLIQSILDRLVYTARTPAPWSKWNNSDNSHFTIVIFLNLWF